MLGYNHTSTITQAAKKLPIERTVTNDKREAMILSNELGNQIKLILSQLNPPLEFADLRVDDISQFSRVHIRFIDVIIEFLDDYDDLLLEPIRTTQTWIPTSKKLIALDVDDEDELFAGVVTALCLTNTEWRFSTLYKGLNELQHLDLLGKIGSALARAARQNALIEFESPVQFFIGDNLINTL
jgi:hypothetical protein